MRCRVILGEDHELVRDGLTRLLEPEFEVVSAVGDGRTLIQEVERLRPDVVITDIGLPLLNGIDAAAQIRRAFPEQKLVFLSQYSGKEYLQAAFHVGALGYLVKSSATSELLVALREALAGRYYISAELRARYPELSPNLTENPVRLFGANLTLRQREVLQLVAEGKSAKEIAHLLNISVKTVEFHKAGIMDELGLRTTAELTRYAMQHGMVAV